MAKKKLLLIDGNSIAFKAYFALPKYKFKNASGGCTNAIYGFARMLESVLNRLEPTHVLVAFDAGKTTFRTEKYSAYKGGRPSTEPELVEQFLPLRKYVEAMGICHYELPNYEADDIIGTYARLASMEGFEVVIISGDRDLTQLANQEVTVEISKRGVTEVENYTPETMKEKLGIIPAQMTDLKGLMGDKSDNIPGVTKIGEKTALKLLGEYDTIENLYEHLDELKPSKMKENLIREKEMAFLSKELATINQYSPVSYTLSDFLYTGAEEEKLREFYEENNFEAFLKELNGELEVIFEKIHFTEVKEFSHELVDAQTVLHFEMLDENYHKADVLAIAWNKGNELFVAKPEILEQEAFIDYLQDEGKEKQIFDVKSAMVMLLRHHIFVKNVIFDAMLAGYILDILDKKMDIASLARHYGFSLQTKEAFYGKGVKKSIPAKREVLFEFVARKVHVLAKLRELMDKDLEKVAQKDLFYEVELPLAGVLAKMESAGISVRREVLEKMALDNEQELAILTEKIYQQAGREFNINSPKQLGELLFETLGFDHKLYSKKTKTGYSTSAEVLEKMSLVAPIVQDILNYRELTKLQSTYVVGLQHQIGLDNKIHTRYQQALTQTGRLSSVDPNLQNIPVRTELGRNIRKAFVPSKEGWLIYSADYSQIELRVLADVSKDLHLQEAFVQGEDIHTTTAMRVFGIENANEVSSLDRRNAKAVNFGVVYGISEWGLAKNLDIEPFQAKSFIEKYFEKYPGIKNYMEEIVQTARDNGYTETIFHRRRYLPEIHDRNFARRSFAERTAINSPIQGSAADLLKIAMNALDKRLEESSIQANMLLQVHDELIFEVAKEDVEQLDRLVKEVMETTVKLSVPLVADSSWGESWFEAK